MTPIVLSKSRVTILLLAMITLMLLLTVVVWFSVSEEALRVPAPHRYSMPELSEPGPLDSNLESVSERPLLWPSRRPASRSEQTAEMAADVSPEGISALGIILQGDTRTALLSLPAGVQRVYVGSEIPGGWKVMAIEPGRVRLESDDNSFDLEVARPRNEAIRLEPVAEPE